MFRNGHASTKAAPAEYELLNEQISKISSLIITWLNGRTESACSCWHFLTHENFVCLSAAAEGFVAEVRTLRRTEFH